MSLVEGFPELLHCECNFLGGLVNAAGRSKIVAVTVSDQWQADRLDLDAYLRRIGHAGPLAPDEATLAALHRAHVAAVPFENLDVILGRPISVDLGEVQAKLVTRCRGGYCYEHAILFGAVLDRVCYRVHRLLARTGDPFEHPRPRSHAVLRRELGPALAPAEVAALVAALPPVRPR